MRLTTNKSELNMQISNNYNTQSFKGLNYTKVYGDGLKLVKKELPQLQELGKKYEIKLSTHLDPMFDTEYIDAYVYHLNKKPNFLKRFFDSEGWADCQVDCESITDAVKKAIATLK